MNTKEKNKMVYHGYRDGLGRMHNFLRPFYDNGSSVTWHERNQQQDPTEDEFPAPEEHLFI